MQGHLSDETHFVVDFVSFVQDATDQQTALNAMATVLRAAPDDVLPMFVKCVVLYICVSLDRVHVEDL